MELLEDKLFKFRGFFPIRGFSRGFLYILLISPEGSTKRPVLRVNELKKRVRASEGTHHTGAHAGTKTTSFLIIV
jgi:hypothetical protein